MVFAVEVGQGLQKEFDLLDKIGIEILNPIQWRCPGLGREELVREVQENTAMVVESGFDFSWLLRTPGAACRTGAAPQRTWGNRTFLPCDPFN